MKKYYNYIYLDPRKPAKLTIEEFGISLLFEPYYIGKGSGDRLFSHLYEKGITRKNTLIKHLQNNGYDIKSFIIKICEYIDEVESFDNEINLIKHFGRKDINSGILLNGTDGGDGPSGRIPWNKGKVGLQESWIKGKTQSLETKEKISKSKKGQFKGVVKSLEHKEKISNALKGHKRSKSECERISKMNTGKNNGFSKTIQMLSLDGSLIKQFDTIREADKYLRNNSIGTGWGVGQVINGHQKSAYGYLWKVVA